MFWSGPHCTPGWGSHCASPGPRDGDSFSSTNQRKARGELTTLSSSHDQGVSPVQVELNCLKSHLLLSCVLSSGLPWWLSGKEPACQCRRCKRRRLDPWVRKIPWRREWLRAPVFLPGESHGQRNLAGYSLWSAKNHYLLGF